MQSTLSYWTIVHRKNSQICSSVSKILVEHSLNLQKVKITATWNSLFRNYSANKYKLLKLNLFKENSIELFVFCHVRLWPLIVSMPLSNHHVHAVMYNTLGNYFKSQNVRLGKSRAFVQHSVHIWYFNIGNSFKRQENVQNLHANVSF